MKSKITKFSILLKEVSRVQKKMCSDMCILSCGYRIFLLLRFTPEYKAGTGDVGI